LRRDESNRPLWIFPLFAVVLVAAWQWATVTANYRGNWTALFCTGALQRHPPPVGAEHVYLFANSAGYDGQFYRLIAHDPLLRSDLKTYVDDARLRYRRILIPLLAYGLALGRSQLIEPAYELVCLLGIGLGVYWSCRFAQQVQLPAAWGMVFLLMPAIPITADRMVVDAGPAALTAAFLCYRQSPWKLFAVLMCAALARETGVLLILAYCAYLLWRREIRMAGVFLLSGLPALAWYCYVQGRTPSTSLGLSLVPFSSVLTALANPSHYPPGTPLAAAVYAADYLALTGLLVAFGMALLWFIREPSDPLHIAAMLFATMGLILQQPGILQSVYHFGRIYTPMLLCLAAIAAQHRKAWLLAPAAMMLPRIAIQLTPQVLGVIRWIA
jgi:hypothetical protein